MPARLFEFCIGSYIALAANNTRRSQRDRLASPLATISLLMLLTVILMAVNSDFDAKKLRLLVTVACVSSILVWHEKAGDTFGNNAAIRTVARLGAMSYSLYLWHQVVLAFYRYCVTFDFTPLDHAICIALSLAIGWASYILMEKRLTGWQKQTKPHRLSVAAVSVVLALIIGFISAKTYRAQGMVRDIPELDIYSNGTAEFPQAYNASVGPRYDHDFIAAKGQLKILVVGDSYGRDWTNVLLESHLADSAAISYHTDVDSTLWQRSRQADVIFLANNADYTRYSDLLPLWLTKKFYRVGHKYFGKTMGPAYMSLRFGDRTAVPTYALPSDKESLNRRERTVFGNRYLDINKHLEVSPDVVTIATPQHKLLSHDGLHLTKAGAKHIAALMREEIRRALRGLC